MFSEMKCFQNMNLVEWKAEGMHTWAYVTVCDIAIVRDSVRDSVRNAA